MITVGPLLSSLEESLREIMKLPVERLFLDFDYERATKEDRLWFTLNYRRANAPTWSTFRFELSRHVVDDAMPQPDELPQRTRTRNFIASAIAYRVSP